MAKPSGNKIPSLTILEEISPNEAFFPPTSGIASFPIFLNGITYSSMHRIKLGQNTYQNLIY